MLLRSILIALQAFLLGSIPTGFLLFRLKKGKDIRSVGSGNIGATNVLRAAGPMLAIVTLLLDATKGFLAVVIADLLAYRTLPQPYVFVKTGSNVPSYHFGLLAMAMCLAVGGNIFTPWLKGRGGKGVATATGVLLAVAPQALALGLLIFVFVLLATRYVSLASIAASISMPFFLAWRYASAYPPVILWAAVICMVLVVARHHANIRRLWMRTEHKIGAKTA